MRDDHPAVAVRPVVREDADAVQALLEDELGQSQAREVAARALGGGDREHRALVAVRDRRLVGVALYGDLLGSDNVVCLRALVLASHDDRETASQLLCALEETARAAGARFVFAELSDEPAVRHTMASLRGAGYHEETRIADYIRDGVDLVFFRRRL